MSVLSFCCPTRDCFCSERTTRAVKALFWWGGSLAAGYIPDPFTRGAVSGALIFKAFDELRQHPDIIRITENAQWTTSRTWKHLTAGTLVFGLGVGYATAAFSEAGGLASALLVSASAVGAAALSGVVAFTDAVFTTNPPHVSEEGQSLLELGSPFNPSQRHAE